MNARRPGSFRSSSSGVQRDETSRLRAVQLAFFCGFLAIILRLGYWQLWKHTELASAAANQYASNVRLTPKRGTIRDRNGQIIVTNEERYRLFAEPHRLQETPGEIADALTPILLESLDPDPVQATDEAWLEQQKDRIKADVIAKISDSTKKWVALATKLTRTQKEQIEHLSYHGLGFDTEMIRRYPDASVSAQLLGFVGKTDTGDDQGYFGLEGFYDLELRGRSGVMRQQTSALGMPLLLGERQRLNEDEGSELTLTIEKSLQYQIEEKLKEALKRYGAVSGDVTVMDPHTGAIIAMASFPNYDPSEFIRHSPSTYRNPIVSDLYEPGSTLKVLTMSAGIESGAVTPDTQCDRCAEPRVISGYTIRTWNDSYTPNINMRDALANSDNTAMVFIQEQVGKTRFLKTFRDFGLGEKTGIDLEGEAQYIFRPDEDWRTLDLATASFGQGIATTSLQVTRAVAAIANGGKLLRPYVVKSVSSQGETVQTQPKVLREVISPETAQQVTEMMIYTAAQGDAKWALPDGVTVAGKTGTAQIAEKGKYLEDKTIASFVGFAPAENPKFVMLVKLREPTSSPWGSETAAPLWFEILPLLL
jgi:cell division protein FtsI/penicillin-binding protein 2